MSVYAKGAELLCERHYGDEYSWPDNQCPVCRAEGEVARLRKLPNFPFDAEAAGEDFAALSDEVADLKRRLSDTEALVEAEGMKRIEAEQRVREQGDANEDLKRRLEEQCPTCMEMDESIHAAHARAAEIVKGYHATLGYPVEAVNAVAEKLDDVREIMEGATPNEDCNCKPDDDGVIHEYCTFHQLQQALATNEPPEAPACDCSAKKVRVAHAVNCALYRVEPLRDSNEPPLGKLITCPACRSSNIAWHTPDGSERWFCKDCRAEWTKAANEPPEGKP